MASRKRILTIHYSRKAESQLAQIYEYNIEKRGLSAADRYIASLKAKICVLAEDYDKGKPIQDRPHLRYLPLKRDRRWKDGNIAVFQVFHETNTVEIWFIFHTKQDWENKL